MQQADNPLARDIYGDIDAGEIPMVANRLAKHFAVEAEDGKIVVPHLATIHRFWTRGKRAADGVTMIRLEYTISAQGKASTPSAIRRFMRRVSDTVHIKPEKPSRLHARAQAELAAAGL